MIRAIRGTRDLLPPDTGLWNRVEDKVRAIFARYHFHEIRTPIFEDTQLFSRGVGEDTDIVTKEMFTWEDKGRAASEKSQSVTLRPEATAGIPSRAPPERTLPPVLPDRCGDHWPSQRGQ
jgi:histidyl-tRNA synthetase